MTRLALILALAVMLAAPAMGHDVYQHWMVPGTQSSCCHDRDCGPAESWRVKGDRYEVKWQGQWLPVPPGAVLRNVEAPDGRGHVCVPPATAPRVVCFKPGLEG